MASPGVWWGLFIALSFFVLQVQSKHHWELVYRAEVNVTSRWELASDTSIEVCTLSFSKCLIDVLCNNFKSIQKQEKQYHVLTFSKVHSYLFIYIVYRTHSV